GATHEVNAATAEDPVARIHEICGRGGADYAIEAVGSAGTIDLALRAVHRGGTVVVLGISPAGTRVPVGPSLLGQERGLTGGAGRSAARVSGSTCPCTWTSSCKASTSSASSSVARSGSPSSTRRTTGSSAGRSGAAWSATAEPAAPSV